MATEDDLRRAIENRLVVLLQYRGDGEPVRTVHPHGLYVTTQDNLCVETYQVDGYTSGDPLPQWRPFTIDKIVTAAVLDDEFAIAPGWNPSADKYRNGFLARVDVT